MAKVYAESKTCKEFFSCLCQSHPNLAEQTFALTPTLAIVLVKLTVVKAYRIRQKLTHKREIAKINTNRKSGTICRNAQSSTEKFTHCLKFHLA